MDNPAVESIVAEEPIPILEAPVIDNPAVESIVAEEPIPILEAPVIDNPAVESVITEEPILEAPVADTPTVELIVAEEPIQEMPVQDANATVESIVEVENNDNVNELESYSNQETLGDSIHQSINSSIISDVPPNSNTIIPDKNITEIVEINLEQANNTNLMENIESQNKLIIETNFNNIDKNHIDKNKNQIPEPEIIELDNHENNEKNENYLLHKSNVTFSSADLQEIINFDTIQSNHLGNTSSLNTSSEFSYTKKIKDIKQPNLITKPSYKNIRLSNPLGNTSPLTKKKHKKQIELDEVDYLYNKLQDYSRYLTINITNYMIIITKAMEIIENYEDFTSSAGYGKKEVVIKAINRLVMIDLELEESDKRVFLSTLSNFIELIIMCSKRHTKDSSKSTKDNFNSRNDKIDDMVLASCGQIVFSLIDKLTTIILKNQYNAEKITHNIPTITEILMLMADKYDYLTGFEKKNIVMQAMTVFIKDKLEHIIDLEKDKKQEIIEILQCVPNTIDLFIALQKQKYKINKKRIIKVKKSGCLTSIFATKKSYEDD